MTWFTGLTLQKIFNMNKNYLFSTFIVCALAVSSCNKSQTTSPAANGSSVATSGTASHTAARISGATMLGAPVAEEKFYKLFQGYDHTDNFEASGLHYLNGYFYVVFDNRYKIGKVKSTLPVNSANNSLLSSGSGSP